MEKQVSPLTVAIVDDDEFVLDAVKTVLDDHHLNTQTYTSGEEFLSSLKNNIPDCLILDSNLPGLSGIEVADTINNGKIKIPIIVLTAYPSSSQTIKIKNLGVSDILVKPVTAESLIEHIEAAVKPKKLSI